jgi:hypothetical protein
MSIPKFDDWWRSVISVGSRRLHVRILTVVAASVHSELPHGQHDGMVLKLQVHCEVLVG